MKQTLTGDEFRESVASYFTTLASKRDFAGVIECYDTYRELIGETGGSWAARLLLQVSNAYASLTDYPAALRTARVAQSLITSDGDSILLAEIFTALGSILRDLGQVKEARKAFQDAESIFRRNDNQEGQCRALNHLAGLFFAQAEYRNALRTLLDAVDIARLLGDKRKLAFMMGNIGRIHSFMDEFTEAEKNLQINRELSAELDDKLETGRALLSIAYLQIQRQQFNAARNSLEQALPLLENSGSLRDIAMHQSYVGELSLRADNLENALSELEEAYQLARRISVESTLTGRIMRLLAECSSLQSNYRAATRHAAAAMVIAEESGNKVEIGILLRVKAEIAGATMRSQVARKLFHRSMDMLGEAGVRFEKARSLVSAGSAECFSSRERATYLFRAEEYYSRCGITSALNQVEKLLSNLDLLEGKKVEQDSKLSSSIPSHSFLTKTPEIEKFLNQLPRLAHPDLPILLTGETGVGKDHMARHLHSVTRPDGPYVTINCASVPETLLESELFGYVRGAFTGADSDKEGLFVAANRGVLFLDEIGDMPLSLQAKLLGVLERRKITPLGSIKEVALDLIIVTATNQPLEEMVENGRFRRDLYYRVSGVSFEIPSLRDRKQDISLLLELFLKCRSLLGEKESIPEEMLAQFLDYDWPGNVRELDNKVKRLQIMSEMVAEGDLVEISRSLFGSIGRGSQLKKSDGSLFDRVERFERKLITEALLAADGNKSRAARLLGIHEATVRTKIKRYGIDCNDLQAGGSLAC